MEKARKLILSDAAEDSSHTTSSQVIGKTGNSTESLYHMDPTLAVLMSVVLCLMGGVGALGNGAVVVVVLRQAHLRRITYALVANLCTVGLLNCLFTIPLHTAHMLAMVSVGQDLANTTSITRRVLPWKDDMEGNSMFCTAQAHVNLTLLLGTLINSAAIAISRYKVITTPHVTKGQTDSRTTITRIVFFLWALPILVALSATPLLGFNMQVCDCYFQETRKAFWIMNVVLALPAILSTLSMLTIYVLIIKKVRDARLKISSKQIASSTAAIIDTKPGPQHTLQPSRSRTISTSTITDTKPEAEHGLQPSRSRTISTSTITDTKPEAEHGLQPSRSRTISTSTITDTKPGPQHSLQPSRSSTISTSTITDTKPEAEHGLQPSRSRTISTSTAHNANSEADSLPGQINMAMIAVKTTVPDAENETSSLKTSTKGISTDAQPKTFAETLQSMTAVECIPKLPFVEKPVVSVAKAEVRVKHIQILAAKTLPEPLAMTVAPIGLLPHSQDKGIVGKPEIRGQAPGPSMPFMTSTSAEVSVGELSSTFPTGNTASVAVHTSHAAGVAINNSSSRRDKGRQTKTHHTTEKKASRRLNKEVNLTLHLFLACLFFCAFYLPLCLAHLVDHFTSLSAQAWLTFYNLSLAFTSNVWIAYALVNSEFRKAFQALVKGRSF